MKGFSQSDPRPYLEVEIDGHSLPFLCDSGAQVNTMSQAFFEQYFAHKRRQYLTHPGLRLVGAGNNPMGLSEVYYLPVKRAHKTEYISFCVVDNNEYNILGIPAMQA